MVRADAEPALTKRAFEAWFARRRFFGLCMAAAVVISAGAAAAGLWLAWRANDLVLEANHLIESTDARTQKQNELIDTQNALLEAQRRSRSMSELTSILEAIAREKLRGDETGAEEGLDYRPGADIVARLVALSIRLTPYRFLEAEKGRLTDRPYSRERGELLTTVALYRILIEDPDRYDLSWADFSSAYFPGAVIPQKLNLRGLVASRCFARRTKFKQVDLRRADFDGADLRGAEMIACDLQGASLREAELERVNLNGCDLRLANLAGANMEGVNMLLVDLRRVDLRGVELGSCESIEGANLSGANIDSAARKTALQRGAVDISDDAEWNRFRNDYWQRKFGKPFPARGS